MTIQEGDGMSERDDALSDAAKATAYDIERVIKKHVDELRAKGQDDLADKLERLGRVARSVAQELDTTDFAEERDLDDDPEPS